MKREFGDWQPGLGNRTAEVTPGGGGLVFMSDGQAVGGVAPEVEGVRLEEVYVYDYASGVLSCASCGTGVRLLSIWSRRLKVRVGFCR